MKCGKIDATDIKAYIAEDGYVAAHNAYNNLTPQDITNEVLRSGLRGRGGAGFPTGKKWEITALQQNENDASKNPAPSGSNSSKNPAPSGKKYIVCNADEGDPGAFMDRSILEGNPHSVIEGMLLAAKAIGADEGYVYVRTEYPLACSRLKDAIKQCYDYGILGDNIFMDDKLTRDATAKSSGAGDGPRSFDINVMEGAGAFVCGEETALIASIEGQRGMPKPKPPFPAVSGLFGKPTCINNVETLSTVPLIMQIGPSFPALSRKGADWFKTIGTAAATGTKTFAVTGNIANTGLVEVPFGTTLRHIVENICGGGAAGSTQRFRWEASLFAETFVKHLQKANAHRGGRASFKAVQIGGPSGGCLTAEHLDMPLDYNTLQSIGAMVGSGGLVVMNQSTCMVAIAKFFMKFTQGESCGKCVICHEGTKQMLQLLTDITEGTATIESLNLLEELALSVKEGSLCGWVEGFANLALTVTPYFRKYYTRKHVNVTRPFRSPHMRNIDKRRRIAKSSNNHYARLWYKRRQNESIFQRKIRSYGTPEWRRNRQKLQTELKFQKKEDEKKERRMFDNDCSTKAVVFRNLLSDEIDLAVSGCGRWDCLPCSMAKAKQNIMYLTEITRDWASLLMYTFTIRHEEPMDHERHRRTLSYAFERTMTSITGLGFRYNGIRLNKRGEYSSALNGHYPNLRYLRIMERHQNGYLHIHMLCDTFLPIDLLREKFCLYTDAAANKHNLLAGMPEDIVTKWYSKTDHVVKKKRIQGLP